MAHWARSSSVRMSSTVTGCCASSHSRKVSASICFAITPSDVRSELGVEPRFLDPHLAEMPAPAWLTQGHHRLRFRIKISAAEARLAAADFNETVAVAVKAGWLDLAGDGLCDVL